MMRAFFLISLAALLVGCGMAPRIEEAANKSVQPVALLKSDWPRALTPPEPAIHVEGLQAPVIEGHYGKCKVIKIDESDKGTVLFHVGRIEGASPKLGATATFTHPAPDSTKVTFTVNHGSFANMSLIYPAYTERVKGHVIYVGTMSMLSQPEQEFLERLRERGWHVAAVVPFTVMSEFQQLAMDPALRHRPAGEAAPRVAQLIDHHLANQTYSVESLVRYLEERDPEFLVGRRVLIGGSMGSLVVPAIAKRLGKVDGIVLLAGGGNVSRIIHESNLKIFQPGEDIIVDERPGVLVLDRRPKGELVEMKEQIYLASKLDPLRMASTLSGTKVLMLTANSDRIVPSETADLLHHALGMPERWHYRFGHVALFVRLPQQAARIERWMAGVS